MRRFLVIGLERFGRAVAEGLTEAGGEVIGLDEDMSRVEAVRDRIAVAAQVDSVDPEALRAVGAEGVDVAVVAIGENFEAEILAVAVLKELGIPEIVARARTERERKILELVGATQVLFVEMEMGQRLARTLATAAVVDNVKIAEGISMLYWTADERVVGKSVGESELRSRWGLDVVAVKRVQRDGTVAVIAIPDSSFRMESEDILLLVGSDARLQKFTGTE